MSQLSQKEIKEIQLEILDVVAEFCHKNDLTYYLGYGTLIGAVRHEGYIPWDDDIDIVLTRSDYEKFIHDFNESNKDYEVWCDENSDWFPYPFAKVAYKKSILEEKSENMIKNIGINIDVFPLDNIPQDKDKQNKLFKKINRMRKILILKSVVIDSTRSRGKNAILFFSKVLFKKWKPNKVAKQITKLSKEYSELEDGQIGNVVWGYGIREVVPKELFKDTVKLNFQGKLYDAPVGYHEWLSSNYGDYMVLPPESKQVSHHKFKSYLKND